MHSHCVCSLRVHTFDDVDFAAVWPIRTICPESGPFTTSTAGHVSHVQNKEASRVARLALDAHRVSPSAGSDIRMVGTHVDAIAASADQTLRCGSSPVCIVDIAMCIVILLNNVSNVERDQDGELTVKKLNLSKKPVPAK